MLSGIGKKEPSVNLLQHSISIPESNELFTVAKKEHDKAYISWLYVLKIENMATLFKI